MDLTVMMSIVTGDAFGKGNLHGLSLGITWKCHFFLRHMGKKRQCVRKAKAGTGLGKYRDACRKIWILVLVLAHHETGDNYHCRNTGMLLNMFRYFCHINIQVVGNSNLKIYWVWHGGFVIAFFPCSFSPKISLLHFEVSEKVTKAVVRFLKQVPRPIENVWLRFYA